MNLPPRLAALVGGLPRTYWYLWPWAAHHAHRQLRRAHDDGVPDAATRAAARGGWADRLGLRRGRAGWKPLGWRAGRPTLASADDPHFVGWWGGRDDGAQRGGGPSAHRDRHWSARRGGRAVSTWPRPQWWLTSCRRPIGSERSRCSTGPSTWASRSQRLSVERWRRTTSRCSSRSTRRQRWRSPWSSTFECQRRGQPWWWARRRAAQRSRPFLDPKFLPFLLTTLACCVVIFQHLVAMPADMLAKGMSAVDYGLATALNGVVIVLFQPLVVKVGERWPRVTTLIVASVLTGLGFGLMAFAHTLLGVMGTVVVWTAGEMLFAPVNSAIVAEAAPAHLRGRYQGAFSLVWGGGVQRRAVGEPVDHRAQLIRGAVGLVLSGRACWRRLGMGSEACKARGRQRRRWNSSGGSSKVARPMTISAAGFTFDAPPGYAVEETTLALRAAQRSGAVAQPRGQPPSPSGRTSRSRCWRQRSSPSSRRPSAR